MHVLFCEIFYIGTKKKSVTEQQLIDLVNGLLVFHWNCILHRMLIYQHQVTSLHAVFPTSSQA